MIRIFKQEFIRHNKTKYALPLAIWVACEVWDFGARSRLYTGVIVEEQDSISIKYGILAQAATGGQGALG